MAIKRGINPKLAEVGKIKTGYKGKMIKSRNGKDFRPPKTLDYFVITTTERNENGDLVADKAIMDSIGEKPTELKIRLPFDSVDKNFFTQYQSYVGNKRICFGDGEKATRKGILEINKNGYPEVSGDLSEIKEIECNPELCPIYIAGKCKVSGILSVFLVSSPNVGGVHKYRTHSYNAVASILGALEYFYDNTGGILQGLPLKLVMLKKTTNDHGTIAYPTIVIDGDEIMKVKGGQITAGNDIHGLRLLSVDEKVSRETLHIDMAKIEAEAEKAGFFIESDSEKEIQEEYYPEEELENVTPKKEEKKKVSTPKDVSKKLDSKNEEKKENDGKLPEIF